MGWKKPSMNMLNRFSCYVGKNGDSPLFSEKGLPLLFREDAIAILIRLPVWAALFLLAGCSAHIPLIGIDVSDVERKSETIYGPHSGKIYL